MGAAERATAVKQWPAARPSSAECLSSRPAAHGASAEGRVGAAASGSCALPRGAELGTIG